MVLLMFGPPGSGKGTQASRLGKHFGVPSISTGDMLRQECAAGTKLGRIAEKVLARGDLVGDTLVNKMLLERIGRPDCREGFILDGYPRTVEQAKVLDKHLKHNNLHPPIVVQLEVPAKVLLARLSTREQCPACNRIYNPTYQRPSRPGICDADGARLERRNDDEVHIIRTRLQTYERLAAPILAYFHSDRCRIDGTMPPDAVHARILASVAERVSGRGTPGKRESGTRTLTPGCSFGVT